MLTTISLARCFFQRFIEGWYRGGLPTPEGNEVLVYYLTPNTDCWNFSVGITIHTCPLDIVHYRVLRSMPDISEFHARNYTTKDREP